MFMWAGRHYDMGRKAQRCDDLSKLDEFLNLKSVKKALGVPEEVHFGTSNGEVYRAMKEDIMRNLEMLVYAGEYDFICNWLGKIRIPIMLEWNHEFQFCWNHKS
uniref:Uncharacterized protein n=1 Tax=Lactuca sativa TaxID=4236 RepID=A0A9R1XLZ6_LACSA|nr:hypothetical protein LSAT_V11C400191480 [Lactuca sativa]